MKRLGDNWKHGWLCLAKWMHFSMLAALWFIPIQILGYLFDSGILTINTENGFDWESLLIGGLSLAVLPFAFASAEAQTKYFNKGSQNIRVDHSSEVQ